MKKIYLLFAGVLSLTQPVEAQNYVCEPGQELCPDQETCYDPKTQCCYGSIVKNLVTSVTVKISENKPSAALKDPNCSQPRFFYDHYSDYKSGEKDYVYDVPAVPGGPWTVTFNPGICPNISGVYESRIAIETIKSEDCFSIDGLQIGWRRVHEDPKKNVISIIKDPGTETNDSAPILEPQASIN